jgi:hypothetical protein
LKQFCLRTTLKNSKARLIKRLFSGKGMKISAVICVTTLSMVSCVSGEADSPQTSDQNSGSSVVQSTSDFNSSVQPSNGETPQLVEVTNVAFFDYNGDGLENGGEPELQGITLTYQPGNISAATDKNGEAKVQLPPGNYSVTVSDPSNQFKYLTLSNTEFVGIENGLRVNVQKNGRVSVPLAKGFLTWPFSSGVHVGIVYYFEPIGTAANSSGFCSDNSST